MTGRGLTLARSGHATSWRGRLHRLIATPRFQSFAARVPLLRGHARREGEALFDLVAGFAQTQVMTALVALELPERLLDAPVPLPDLARTARVPEARFRVLVRAAVALRLLRHDRRDRVGATQRLAALHGVPGLSEMVRHNALLYRDLADPAAFFRGETPTELAAFWPYVFGAGSADDPAVVARYSALMEQSQRPVIDDTLGAVSLRRSRVLMDVGGGTGSFAMAACRSNPQLSALVLDLPKVAAPARARIAAEGLESRVRFVPGSFRDAALPDGADTISLVRVLFDHRDATVADLLGKVHAALPPGGRLIISEPTTDSRAGASYMALYTMAMGTGRARPVRDIAALCADAGFTRIATPRPRRDFVTSVVVAHRL